MTMAIFYFQYLVLGLAVNICLVLIQVTYLVLYKPFEDPLLQKLEIFNELSTLVAIDLMFVFTDTYSHQAHEHVGYAFVFVLCINILTHMFFLVRATCRNIRLSIRRKAFQKRWNAIYETLTEK
jgi:hypothetical protein